MVQRISQIAQQVAQACRSAADPQERLKTFLANLRSNPNWNGSDVEEFERHVNELLADSSRALDTVSP